MSLFGNQDLSVRNQGVELQNKVNELYTEVEEAPGSIGATVGDGGEYSSIQDALDAGETELHIVSDLTVTADPVAPSADANVHLIIHGESTVTFRDASISGFNNFAGASIRSADPVPVSTSTNAPYGGTVAIEFVSAGYANAGVLSTLGPAVVTDVNVVDNSTQDGAYLVFDCANVQMDNIEYTINEPGPARTLGGVIDSVSLVMRNVVYKLAANTDVLFIQADSDARLHGVRNSVVGASNASVSVLGEGTTVQACDFTSTHVVVPVGGIIMSDCTLVLCDIEDTFGTELLDSDFSIFSNLQLTLAGDMDVRGSGNSFTGGYVTSELVNGRIILSGSNCSMASVALGTGASDPLTVESTASGCAVVGCDLDTHWGGSDFEIEVEVGATNTRVIGNALTALLTDAGTNTKNVGNTP